MPVSTQNPSSGLSGSRPAYLVLMREVLIAQDIALTIADHHPGARVILAGTEDEAVALLQGVDVLRIAFVTTPPGHFAQSELSRLIGLCGGHVVLLGDEAETAGPSAAWDVLYIPFTSEQVVERLVRRQSGCDC